MTSTIKLARTAQPLCASVDGFNSTLNNTAQDTDNAVSRRGGSVWDDEEYPQSTQFDRIGIRSN